MSKNTQHSHPEPTRLEEVPAVVAARQRLSEVQEALTQVERDIRQIQTLGGSSHATRADLAKAWLAGKGGGESGKAGAPFFGSGSPPPDRFWSPSDRPGSAC